MSEPAEECYIASVANFEHNVTSVQKVRECVQHSFTQSFTVELLLWQAARIAVVQPVSQSQHGKHCK